MGCHSWDDLESDLPGFFGPKRTALIAAALNESRAALAANEFKYFRGLLKGAEMWRVLPSLFGAGLAGDIAYLDIETTGLGFPPTCESTTIAVLFKGELVVTHERHLKQEILFDLQREAKLLVTFNGGTFDLPFLRREFGLPLTQPHLDLRYWLANLGHRGGLKKIQSRFEGQIPQRTHMDIDGYDAVKLWRLHLRGVQNALETLMTYNAEDTLVLEHLSFVALEMEAERLAHLPLGVFTRPPLRPIPTQVCDRVYSLLRS